MNQNLILEKIILNKQNKLISYSIVFLIMMYNSGSYVLLNNYFLLFLSILLILYSRLWETNLNSILYVLAVMVMSDQFSKNDVRYTSTDV